MENDKIDELVLSCENQQNYVRNLINYCIENSKNYKMLEIKFMNEIQRKYDHIINVLLKIISPKILIKIIGIKDNEEKIINYLLKFKNVNTIELFLDIVISNGKRDFVKHLMNEKYSCEQSTYHYTLHMSFLNIIIFKTINWGGNSKTISQETIVKIFKKMKNFNEYMEINEFRHYWSNYMKFICDFNFKNFIEIINILINLLDNKSIYDLLKIKIYYDKSNIETKLNLFEYVIVKLMDRNVHEHAIKLIKFFIDELDNNYINFILNECELNLIIANSLKSEYWNKGEIFNLVWRDIFFEHIEPTKLTSISYYKTSILYEALCNKNMEFVKKIILNENISKQIDFDIKYDHFPEYSGTHTFISLALFYSEYSNCREIKNKLIDILNFCFNNFKNVINFSDCKCLHYIINNCFDDFYKLNETFIYDNLIKFNFELMKLEKINEFKKIKQNNNSVKTFLDEGLYTLCKKNNIKFVKYLIDKYFEFNSIDDIDKSNQIIESFEFVCEKNYSEIVDLLESKFIANNLDLIVELKFNNFTQIDTNDKIKKTKKNYYFNKIINYCGINSNYDLIERLFNYQQTHYKFNYFAYIEDDMTFLMSIISYNYPNNFIFNVIDKMDLLCNPSHININAQHTALTMSSIKNNIELFNKLISKFGNNVHPKVNKC